MHRIAIYTWAITAGMAGFVAGMVLGAAWLHLETPELYYFVVLISLFFGVVTALLVSALARAAARTLLVILSATGAFALLMTQLFYWRVLIP